MNVGAQLIECQKLVKTGKTVSSHFFLYSFYWEQVELGNADTGLASVYCKQFPVFACDILSLITSPG